jgi:UDP-glucose 4-epimerase
MNILVTGGAGYIGSHTCLELLNAGYNVIVVDNLSNSKEVSLDRVEELTGKKISFHMVDILDREALSAVFSQYPVRAVIHFAGFKAVGESVCILQYFHNVSRQPGFAGCDEQHGVKISSCSSATVMAMLKLSQGGFSSFGG